jgi:Domain of unknown function (DUF4157)
MTMAQKQAKNNSNRRTTDTRQTNGQSPLAKIDDNRSEAVAQRELMGGIHDSPRMLEQRHQLEGYSQDKFPVQHTAQRQEINSKPNKTGLPDKLKSGIEALSGFSMDNVNVHYNSAKPAQINALAYAQRTDIHLAPRQEKHLPHEAWHVVQQMQGRVQPTHQLKSGIYVNDNNWLENEADLMGNKALFLSQFSQPIAKQNCVRNNLGIVQRGKKKEEGIKVSNENVRYAENSDKAKALLKDYAKQLGLQVSEEIMGQAIVYATKKEWGIDQAEKLISQDKLDQVEKENQNARKSALQKEYDVLLSMLEKDSLEAKSLIVSFNRYVKNPNQHDLTIEGEYSKDTVDDALNNWRALGREYTYVRFWGYGGENKAAAGKGNVGDTLDTREIQANLLCDWRLHTINVHINIQE